MDSEGGSMVDGSIACGNEGCVMSSFFFYLCCACMVLSMWETDEGCNARRKGALY